MHGLLRKIPCSLDTDYCDITGEPDYIQDLIKDHHEEAKKVNYQALHV